MEAQNAAPRAAYWVNGELSLEAGMEKIARAVGACSLMAIMYVALLYAPALFLPKPKSIREHMLRRFACAAIASALAPFFCLAFLQTLGRLARKALGNAAVWGHPGWYSRRSALFDIFGLRTHHLWQGVIYPTLLTALLYLGPLVLGLYGLIECCWTAAQQTSELLQQIFTAVVVSGKNMTSDVLVWRNCLVAPISEELVFRACMVPLLLCGGFSPSATVFLCPMFFALAHLHHFWELIYRQKHEKSTAAMIVGMQLGYTTVFGWYATFLYLRTGHVISPIVAHIFCNTMGLPDVDAALSSSHPKVVGVAYILGVIGFFALLGPLSDPVLFNHDVTRGCDCWSGFCKWKFPGRLVNSWLQQD